MRIAILLVALAIPASANAQFLGGMAEGRESRQRMELEQRALEIDRRYGTSTYEGVAQRNQLDAIHRQLRENAELMERLDRDRFNRLYGPNPRY